MKDNLGLRVLLAIVGVVVILVVNNLTTPHCDRCGDRISGVVYRDSVNHKDFCGSCYSYYRRMGLYE